MGVFIHNNCGSQTAGTYTSDFIQGEIHIIRCLSFADFKFCTDFIHDFFRTLDVAGGTQAHAYFVLSLWFKAETIIKINNAVYLSNRNLSLFGYIP